MRDAQSKCKLGSTSTKASRAAWCQFFFWTLTRKKTLLKTEESPIHSTAATNVTGLKQEIVLGIAGTRMLKNLPFKIRKYHMNEGHSSLLTLELLRANNMDSEKVQNLCVFTTHSPVEAAFDQFTYELIEQVLGKEYLLSDMKQYAGNENLNMAYLALNLSKYVNGVSLAHVDFSRKLFPGRYIRAVTNGVHSFTWTNLYFQTTLRQVHSRLDKRTHSAWQKPAKSPTEKSGMPTLKQKMTC